MTKADVPKSFPWAMKMTPEVAPLGSFSLVAETVVAGTLVAGTLVALSQFSSNTFLTYAQGDTSVTDGRNYVPLLVPQRRRITARLRAEVVEHYMSGMSSRRVATTLGLGRTTVLEILKAAGVDTRPQGRKY
ncbi:MAG: hypothetical protein QOE41_2074 [Mycobacterium sp.]|jgi:hypothetical protein|nr:hypothetical protein [Mycobacterium sp.]MDT5132763.1 hypothetical protein [Mycobacterium sp.]